MSLDRCFRCTRLVNTDFDLDCYRPDPRYSIFVRPDICVCETCRDREERELEDAGSGGLK